VANSRSVRMLTAMGGASTSRVLNLHRIALDHASDPEFQRKPLFVSPIINRSFVLKHRTRADETGRFTAPRAVSTKVIIPIDNDDLSVGGYGLMVEERGYPEMLRNVGHYNSDTLARDMEVLARINELPSLDPFLLREHLRFHNIEAASCYFSISEGDQQRMQIFAEQQLSRLVTLAGGELGASRFVGAMLSSQVSSRLDPLRVTLGLSGDAFREGVFSWRGFLYYKWSMTEFWPDVMGVLRELRAFEPTGAMTPEQKSFLSGARRRIIQSVRDNGDAVTRTLQIYDEAYRGLVANQSPAIFRDFLLSAPAMFLEMGEKLGAISHIVSLWHHRFPAGSRANIGADELSAIFTNFLGGFGETAGDSSVVWKTGTNAAGRA
jgi:hypothetical protein